MKIKRYREDYVNGVVECDDGEYVLFTDACDAAARAVDEAMAKAVAVEQRKTKELRAELVCALSRPIRLHAMRDGDWFHVRSNSEQKNACEHLVRLGAWEGEWLRECWWKYRPIELQDSEK